MLQNVVHMCKCTVCGQEKKLNPVAQWTSTFQFSVAPLEYYLPNRHTTNASKVCLDFKLIHALTHCFVHLEVISFEIVFD